MKPKRMPSWKRREPAPVQNTKRWVQGGTTYFSANCSLKMGDCLGDTITQVAAASIIYDAEQPETVILSQYADNPLNFLWDRFIRHTGAKVVYDPEIGGVDEKFALLDERRERREVDGTAFENYKEAYRRLDCDRRYSALHAGNVDFGKSIIEMYYYGQEYFTEMPYWSVGPHQFLPYPSACAVPFVFLAPDEKCQANSVFTMAFWRRVMSQLAERKIKVVVNSRVPLDGVESTFLPFEQLAVQTAQATVMACGNTGTMWLAAACGTPSVICESGSMIMPEYSVHKNRMAGVRAVVKNADSNEMADRIEYVYHDIIERGFNA
jgi:hypothetical protein